MPPFTIPTDPLLCSAHRGRQLSRDEERVIRDSGLCACFVRCHAYVHSTEKQPWAYRIDPTTREGRCDHQKCSRARLFDTEVTIDRRGNVHHSQSGRSLNYRDPSTGDIYQANIYGPRGDPVDFPPSMG
ncbi:hypothetical protein BOTBODRAFT_453288 [Botryobasidium botryosum FD-172 SS1]|uniref:Uncharacterized protein n=1 Tax=Botryobasidium botryosum (strain FD-172 SS1) TaxID=930990 RepID=A0A067MA61_BOTB1|nr:hypothetical protein BOTBODRAFT_453288 [Botryobasidium botryosum FD-172 SS1]